MPDIQTAFKAALSRTLQEWDADGEHVPQPSTINTTINNSLFAPSQKTQGIPMTKVFNITNNVSRTTFNYIRDNPGSTRKEIITALEHQGYGGGSVSSLIAQLRRNKLVHETNGLHYADVDEYTPLKSLKAIKKKEALAEPKPKRKYTKRATNGVTGIGALLQAKLEAAPDRVASVPDTALPKRLVTLVRTQTPDEIIKNLTVFQARDLYDRLKQIFGG